MKIAHLLPAFSAFNGIAHVVYMIAEGKKSEGNEVSIFSLEADIKPPDDVTLEVMEMPRNSTLQKIYRIIMPLDIYKAIKWVPRLKRFDVIYAHFYPMIWFAYLAQKIYGVKFIYYNHGTPPPELLSNFIEKTYIRIIAILTSWIIRRANSAICISRYLQKDLEKMNLNSEVVYNKIEVNKFSEGLDSLRIRKNYKLGDYPLILYVGRISPHKGCHLLIEAFRILNRKFNSAKLVIVGKYTFPLHGYYNTLQQIADDSVIFTGYVPDEELPYYYAACDVYATGTIWEGFNLPLAEAQACGKPVVAFDIGPHPEIVKDGETGFLVPAQDVKALAEAMIRLLEDKELRLKMGKRGAQFINQKFVVRLNKHTS
ncbi:MAG: glycosyltransferase family 4 protein [Desulfobacteraceae bacterium]|nr:glycosyltransferase family 4 protein [Desulfobacteraceae bacterium]